MADTNNLEKISVSNLTDICRTYMQLSRLDCQSRASLYSAIFGQPIMVQESISAEVNSAIQNGHVKYERKSKESGSGREPSKRRRLNPEVDDETKKNCETLRHFTEKYKEPDGTQHKARSSQLQTWLWTLYQQTYYRW